MNDTQKQGRRRQGHLQGQLQRQVQEASAGAGARACAGASAGASAGAEAGAGKARVRGRGRGRSRDRSRGRDTGKPADFTTLRYGGTELFVLGHRAVPRVTPHHNASLRRPTHGCAHLRQQSAQVLWAVWWLSFSEQEQQLLVQLPRCVLRQAVPRCHSRTFAPRPPSGEGGLRVQRTTAKKKLNYHCLVFQYEDLS